MAQSIAAEGSGEEQRRVGTSTQGFTPFSIFALLLVGGLAFVALLYFIGSGQTGPKQDGSGANALGKSLVGFDSLVQYLEAGGHEVKFAYNEGDLQQDGLLVLTPPTLYNNSEEFAGLIERRRYIGPTLIILPKWFAAAAKQKIGGAEVKQGWVDLIGPSVPAWAEELDQFDDGDGYQDQNAPAPVLIDLDLRDGKAGWQGLGLSGNLPDNGTTLKEMSFANSIRNNGANREVDRDAAAPKAPEQTDETPRGLPPATPASPAPGSNNTIIIDASNPGERLVIMDGDIIPLVRSTRGETMVGYVDDHGYYPDLRQAAGLSTRIYDNYTENEGDYWAVVVVAEPDLMNNLGMSNFNRAQLAEKLVETSMEGEELPIIFDLTLHGLGDHKNLLTLAFTPPFLAATLSLILAMIIIAWRAFMRFGPALAQAQPMAFGKEGLVHNSSEFIARTGRLHLLAQPYAAMMRKRIAEKLALTRPDDEALDNAVARRLPDEPSLSKQIQSLEQAGNKAEIIRRAEALQTIERKLGG